MENVIASDDSVNGSEILQLYRANPWSTAENHNIYYRLYNIRMVWSLHV